MKYKFAVGVGELCAIRLLASEDESRYVLCGVRVEVRSGGVVLAACNGRVLGVLRSEQPAEEGTYAFTIPSDTIDRLKAKTKKESVLAAEYDDETGVIALTLAGWFTLQAEVIDGIYPDWRKTIPPGSSQSRRHFAINPELVQRFYKIGKLLGREDGIGLLHSEDSKDGAPGPIEVKLYGIPQFYGLVMPMKNLDPAIPHPDWLNDDWNPEPHAPHIVDNPAAV